MNIKVKSIYLPAEESDGFRVFTETFWPQGLGIYEVSPCQWIKELSPSYDLVLRRSRENLSIQEYRDHYWAELESSEKMVFVEGLLQHLEKEDVCLLNSNPELRESDSFFLKVFLLNLKQRIISS